MTATVGDRPVNHARVRSKNRQDYSAFRCAKNQPVRPFAVDRCKTTNTLDANHERMIQEYSRHRSATHQTSIAIVIPTALCYSQVSQLNEDDYSRYRHAQTSLVRLHHADDVPHDYSRSLMYSSEVQRFPVPDNRVFWHTSFPDYEPIEYTTEKIQHNPKADPCDASTIDKFNQLDGKIDRRSFMGTYHVDPLTHRPQNPMGRTGMTGRGRLYHWGPNHAGDPVVTRWRRDEHGAIIYRQDNPRSTPKPVLQFVAIERKDTHQWALPGGMVDPGEEVAETVKREFQEETMRNGVDKASLDAFFSNGHKIYESYSDDPRNTDNAWMETVAIHYHDEQGQFTKDFSLNAGDDAISVVWCPIDRKLRLYGSHKHIIRLAVERLNAFW